MTIARGRIVLLLLVVAVVRAADADVAFLAGDEAKAAIVDESVEPYFALLQPAEMAAKTGSPVPGADVAAQRDACRARYRDAIESFTPEQQQAIRGIVASVQPMLARDYPLFAREPWRFIKVARAIEGGLPHTRGHCIVLSDDGLFPVMATPKQGPNLGGARLLVHEQTHVVQRLHPQPFADLYVRVWGFVRMSPAPKPTAAQLAHQLVNPDGVDCGWAWPVFDGPRRTLLQPLLIVGTDAAQPKMPEDFQENAYEVVSGVVGWSYALGADGEPRGRDLATVDGYAAAFLPAHEIFHPNEIAADQFSQLVVRDLARAPGQEPEHLRALRTWARVGLAAP